MQIHNALATLTDHRKQPKKSAVRPPAHIRRAISAKPLLMRVCTHMYLRTCSIVENRCNMLQLQPVAAGTLKTTFKKKIDDFMPTACSAELDNEQSVHEQS